MRGVLEIPRPLLPVHEALLAGLQRVTERFDSQLDSDLLAVHDLVRHVERYRGKMLRPALVLLSGMACSNRAPAEAITDDLVTIGAVCELVHMATLVHDDVLDEADVRRRGATVNKLRGNETAVILGDYLIAAAYHLCSTLGDTQPALAIGRVSMTLCAGELLQLANRDNLSLDRATYFEILDRKTAALIAVSCELGARRAGATEAQSRALESFGRNLGVAFQIQDDLLDLTGEEAEVGKSVRKDLEKGKLTLPLIDHLATGEGRVDALREIEASIAGDPAAPARLVALLRSSGAIDDAREHAESLVAEACRGLESLPGAGARAYLLHMAQAVVSRTF